MDTIFKFFSLSIITGFGLALGVALFWIFDEMISKFFDKIFEWRYSRKQLKRKLSDYD
jgi:hypothetical protein